MNIHDLINKYKTCPICGSSLEVRLSFISSNEDFAGPINFNYVHGTNYHFKRNNDIAFEISSAHIDFQKNINKIVEKSSLEIDNCLIIDKNGDEIHNPLFLDDLKIENRIIYIYCNNVPLTIKHFEKANCGNSHFWLSADINNTSNQFVTYDHIYEHSLTLNIFFDDMKRFAGGCNIFINFMSYEGVCYLTNLDKSKFTFSFEEDLFNRSISNIKKRTPKGFYNRIKIGRTFS